MDVPEADFSFVFGVFFSTVDYENNKDTYIIFETTLYHSFAIVRKYTAAVKPFASCKKL
jgi:hypothetical protein